ncbi:hypothetical protein BG61_15980 [Caballeronia glathei]|jgi:hypothetical protein|uniref:Uncharacterized protein n=1 Tax=Caballeronia glathei TaxID=60547 RepID=A0A069PWF6_9BURK|nr:hypothetical protein BG61_15980 [Caballeronia glathei]
MSVESTAIFAEEGCSVHPTAPDVVLTLPELYYFLRTRLNRFRATHARYLDPHGVAIDIDWSTSRGLTRE